MGRPVQTPWSFTWKVVLGSYLAEGRLEYDDAAVLKGAAAFAFTVFECTRLMTADLRHLLRVASFFERLSIYALEARGLGHCISGQTDGRAGTVRLTHEDIFDFDVDASDIASVSMTFAGRCLLESDEMFALIRPTIDADAEAASGTWLMTF